MSKKDDMLKKLSGSLDKANRREAKRKKPAAPAPMPAADRTTCTKCSVSLFQTDIERLDAIYDYMRDRGHRLSRSQIIKVALRTAPLTDELMQAYEESKNEDGRKHW